ncbi:SDR family NAD(P)-dependent oxidoreductase [Streptomyces griseoluteus]|uniref:SDR family oxidoreductase n=1 Tax=Streptomyces griseoluteus TaxID=29306 RepID=UPI0036E374B8
MNKVVLITGAGRGLGLDVAERALLAGHRVVATARDPQHLVDALGGPRDDLLTAELDVTDSGAAPKAVETALQRFGRIDVLVNNAATLQTGYFEELSPAQMRQQIETNLFGPMNVTRAVLPVMRQQRSGHLVTISSIVGLVGFEFAAAYVASKFAVEGWMETLREEVRPYGIRATTVEPGFFRTGLLSEASTTWAEPAIDDYAERGTAMRKMLREMNGRQVGDPAKLAAVLLRIIEMDEPPSRFIAGADATEAIEALGRQLLEQVRASRELAPDLAHESP